DEGRPVDGAGKLLFARRTTGTPRASLWAAAGRGRAGGPDRRRQRGIDPERRPRADVAQPPRGGRARQRQGSGHGGWFRGRIDEVEGQGAAALEHDPAKWGA